jgi:hypothetical protein
LNGVLGPVVISIERRRVYPIGHTDTWGDALTLASTEPRSGESGARGASVTAIPNTAATRETRAARSIECTGRSWVMVPASHSV